MDGSHCIPGVSYRNSLVLITSLIFWNVSSTAACPNVLIVPVDDVVDDDDDDVDPPAFQALQIVFKKHA